MGNEIELIEEFIKLRNALKPLSRGNPNDLDERNKLIKEFNRSIVDNGDFSDALLRDILQRKVNEYNTNPESDQWQWIASLVSILYQRGKDLEFLVALFERELLNESNISKEYSVDWLIELGSLEAVKEYLLLNPEEENHYLIEKILRSLADSDKEIGEAIVAYLTHYSGFVRDAALQYLYEKELRQFGENICEAMLAEPDEDFRIIKQGLNLLVSWGQIEFVRVIVDFYEDKMKGYSPAYLLQSDVRDFKTTLNQISSNYLNRDNL